VTADAEPALILSRMAPALAMRCRQMRRRARWRMLPPLTGCVIHLARHR